MSSSQINRRQNRRGKRPQRMTSNVFAMFDQTQIQEFKEAFNMIDSNHDQIIDADDLREVYRLLNKIRSFETTKAVFSGPIFKLFLINKLSHLPTAFSRVPRQKPNRRRTRIYDKNGTRAHQLHHVPHNVWRKTERHGPGRRYQKRVCVFR